VPAEFLEVAVHEGPQLADGAVLAAHLADLPAHGHLHAPGLDPADERRDVGGDREVVPLLLRLGGLAQVHDGGGVDVDVVEARLDGLADEFLHRIDFLLRLRGEPLHADLKVVPLQEEGSSPARLDRRGRDGAGVLGGALLGVADLGARDLENDGSHAAPEARPEDGLCRIVGQPPDVDGRHGEALRVAPAHGLVERLDGGREHAEHDAGPPDEPAGGLPDPRIVRQDSRVDEMVDERAPKLFLVEDPDIVPLDLQDAFDRFPELVDTAENHASPPCVVVQDRNSRALSTS